MNTAEPRHFPFPTGWFFVGFSHEFKKEKVQTKKILGQELIVFRTPSGAISILDAYCPHLGAHLGHGGTVVGESIRCPFHGFCFDKEGTCVSSYPGKDVPKTLSIKKWVSHETRGLIFLWFDEQGRGPLWEISEFDTTHWSTFHTCSWTVSSHPLDTNENSVDIGHFQAVHSYTGLEILQKPEAQGHHFQVKYKLVRQGLGWSKKPFSAEIDIHLDGLGYSFVNVYLPTLQVKVQLMTFHTPIEKDLMKITIALVITENKLNERFFLLKYAPKKLLDYLISKILFTVFINDLGDDIKIWKYKTYLTQPKLVPGDGPIGKYRKWAAQFYEVK